MVRQVLGAFIVAATALGGAMALTPHSVADAPAFRIHPAGYTQMQKGPAVTQTGIGEFGGTWQLTHLRPPGSDLAGLDADIVARSQIVIGADGALSGTVGCNRFGTQLSLSGAAQVAFSGVRSTRKMCHGAVWDAERGLFAAFRDASQIARTGDQLFLYDARGNEIARFARG